MRKKLLAILLMSTLLTSCVSMSYVEYLAADHAANMIDKAVGNKKDKPKAE